MTGNSVSRKTAGEQEYLPILAAVYSRSKRVADFLDGLLRPSAVAVGIALLINVIAFVTAVTLVTPNFVADHGRDFLADSATDYDMFATATLFGLARRPAEQPFVAILGGSTTRAALLEEDIAEGLHALNIPDHEIFKLCTARQSLWETLAIVERLPKHRKGIVVIGVGPSLFTMGPSELESLSNLPRLGFRSGSLDDALRSHGLSVRPETGNYFIDNAAFLLARFDAVWRYALTGQGSVYIESQYVGREPIGPRAWLAHSSRVNARFTELERNWPGNVAILEQVIETVRTRTDAEVILVETPVNPRFVTEFHRGQLVSWHAEAMRRFARDKSVPYVRLNDEAGLEARDFFDWAHLRDRAAIKRCADAVLRYIRSAESRVTDTSRENPAS